MPASKYIYFSVSEFYRKIHLHSFAFACLKSIYVSLLQNPSQGSVFLCDLKLSQLSSKK